MNKDITLVQGEDGVYSEPTKSKPITKRNDKNVDQFFEGMDKGIDFLEGLDKRLSRIFKIK